MSDWVKANRLDAGKDVFEKNLQSFFDEWRAWGTNRFVAGCPDYLWRLGRSEPRTKRKALGYGFTPDVLWRWGRDAVVAELKYGVKYEPLGVAEVLHHANVLRRIGIGQRVTPVLVTQYSGWVRAAADELGPSKLLHHEADLLRVGPRTICWISNPHAKVSRVRAPPRVPLPASWGRQKFWKVAGEPTWYVSEAKPNLFSDRPFALISEVRGAQGFILWSGRLPGLGEQWGAAQWRRSGAFWFSAAGATPSGCPPPPAPG